jgi:hypothetical protein
VSEQDRLTVGDWARYGGLFALATLVLLVMVGAREGGFAILVAVYLVLGAAALLFVQLRRRRS